MRNLVVWTAAFMVVSLAGCGGGATEAVTPTSSGASGTIDVTGRLTLTAGQSDASSSIDEPCSGVSGYNDIESGAEIRLTDAGGTVVGVSHLGEGAPNADADTCLFAFTITDVPTTSKFYEVMITHRGGPHYTVEQLKAGLTLTFG